MELRNLGRSGFKVSLAGLGCNNFGMRVDESRTKAVVDAALEHWITLYQLHFPDPSTPMDETLAAFDDLVHAGKVLYLGSSNLAGWQIADAEHLARQAGGTRFVSAQNEWSLLVREVEREV